MTFKWPHISVLGDATVTWLGTLVSPTYTVYVDVTLTRSKVKVKVTGLLNFQQLAKSCMLSGGDDRSPLAGLSGSNNATNLHHLTTHSTTVLLHKMAIVLQPQISLRDVISPYVFHGVLNCSTRLRPSPVGITLFFSSV